MRFILAFGLLGLLTACQTAQLSSTNPVLAASFPAPRWASRTVNVAGREVVTFTCPEERCGERIVVAVVKMTTTSQNGITTEDMLRLRSVNDAFLKESFTTLLPKAFPSTAGKIEVRSVRKLAKDPVGIFLEGEGSDGKQFVPFVAEVRVRGTRTVTTVALARKANTARNSLRLVRIQELLN